MFPAHIFPVRFFPPRYYPEVGATSPPGYYFAPRYFAKGYFAPRYFPGVATVIQPSILVSPSSVLVAQTGVVLTVTGTGTTWLSVGPSFSFAGVAGLVITNVAVINDTHATITINSGSATGTATLADATSGASVPFGVVSAGTGSPIFQSGVLQSRVISDASGSFIMGVRSGQSVATEFTTRAFSTGVGTDADSLPAATLYVNGTANGALVTVTNQATGVYKAAVTLPTLAVNDVVSLLVTATRLLVHPTA